MAGSQPGSPHRELATVLIEGPPATSTIQSSIVTMINSAVGAGVLSLPYAFWCTGWAAGLACLASVAALESFTLYVCARFAEQTGSSTYGELVHKMLGRRASLAMCAVFVAFLWGACCAYLMIIGDSFNPLLAQAFGSAWWNARNACIAAIGCAVVLPLCLRTSLGALRAVSSLAVSAIVVVVGAVIISSARRVRRPGHPWDAVQAFNPSLQFFSALPILIFSFVCHQNVISVFAELEERPPAFQPSHVIKAAAAAAADGDSRQMNGQQPHERQQQQQHNTGYESLPAVRLVALRSQRRLKSGKLRGMVWVIVASIAVTSVLYAAMGLAGYLAFPADAQADILVNFGCTNPYMQVARAAIGIIVVASYPVAHFPARAAVGELLQHSLGWQVVGARFAVGEALAFFGSTLAVALRCTDLGIVFKLIGGTCCSMLVLAMPGAFLMKDAWSKHCLSRRQLQQLQEPLLQAEGGDGDSSRHTATQLAGPVYNFWRSSMFWAGVGLQLLAAAVTVHTVVTVLQPLPLS